MIEKSQELTNVVMAGGAIAEMNEITPDHVDDSLSIDNDSDIVDPEVEAELYAQIYHRDLDLNPPDVKYLRNGEEMDSAPNDFTTTVPSVQEASTSANIKNSFYFVDLEESSEKCDDAGKTSFSFQITGCASNAKINGALKSGKRRFEFDDPEEQPPSKRFRWTPSSEWAAKFTVHQIQRHIGGAADDWQISNADLCISTSFQRRYYSDKTQQTLQCRRCHGFSHFARDCKQRLVICCDFCGGRHKMRHCTEHHFCIICYRTGHPTTKCNTGPAYWNDTCKRCGSYGHLANVCPDRWRQYHSTTKVDEDDQVRLNYHGLLPKAERKSKSKYCYNCGRAGHLGHECRRSTMNDGRVICLNPSVAVYDIDPDVSVKECKGNPSTTRGKKDSPKRVKKASHDDGYSSSSTPRKSTPSDQRSRYFAGRSNFEKLKKTLTDSPKKKEQRMKDGGKKKKSNTAHSNGSSDVEIVKDYSGARQSVDIDHSATKTRRRGKDRNADQRVRDQDPHRKSTGSANASTIRSSGKRRSLKSANSIGAFSWERMESVDNPGHSRKNAWF